jgi:hypothetical protein
MYAHWKLIGAILATGAGMCACGSSTSVQTTAGAQAQTTSVSSPTPKATATPVPSAVLTPSAVTMPDATSTGAFISHSHPVLAACRLVTAQTVSSIAGTALAKDAALSGAVGGNPGGPANYVQDDCAYSGGGLTIRVILFEPSRGGGTSAQGQSAFEFAQGDLEGNGATLGKVSGVGDAAAVWAPAGSPFAQVIVLDHDVVFDVGVENVANPLNKALELATAALIRADSGAANGAPGS